VQCRAAHSIANACQRSPVLTDWRERPWSRGVPL
jgi:hypothetical protein